ncbi:hypothetical protein [Saccharibacillus sp. O23]|uniref:hypothetical protein n=1 Tax=Saccharibacillus sp. O23 TaxID=2009338 RepID=UPI00117BCD7B|nr:hypothetical protein [Saccharibacillus sp. O23]
MIVVAETRTRFEDREHVLNYTERDEARSDLPPALSGFCTKTPITLRKILKQPTADTIREQEELEILEPAALIKQEQGIQKVTMENYREIEPGSKYILYLKANTNGDYAVINMNNGKFDLENDSAQTKRLEENEEEQEIHERLKQSAKQRFAEEIADLNI